MSHQSRHHVVLQGAFHGMRRQLPCIHVQEVWDDRQCESGEEHLQLQILQEQYPVFRAEDSLRFQVADARDSGYVYFDPIYYRKVEYES